MAMMCVAPLASFAADAPVVAQPNRNLVPIVSGVAREVTRVEQPALVAASTDTHIVPAPADLSLAVAKADPWTYPQVTMVGALTISDRYAGWGARQSRPGLASFTFTQIRLDGTPGDSVTVLFDKTFARDLSLLAADLQEKGSSLIVEICFDFTTNLSLEHLQFLEQGRGTDFRIFDPRTGQWSNWRSYDELAAANAAVLRVQHAAFLQQAVLDSDLVRVKLYASPTTVNVKNSYGVMPLHMAIISGKIDMVKALVEAGADVNAMNGSRSPLTMATETGKTQIADYLKDRGAK
jgi:hypothetical protein